MEDYDVIMPDGWDMSYKYQRQDKLKEGYQERD